MPYLPVPEGLVTQAQLPSEPPLPVCGEIIVPDGTNRPVINGTAPEPVPVPEQTAIQTAASGTLTIVSNCTTLTSTSACTYYSNVAGGWIYINGTPTGGTASTGTLLAPTHTTPTASTWVQFDATAGWRIVSNGNFRTAELTEADRERMRTIEILRKARDFKKAKPSIKRALRLMANFGMEEDVRVFMSGGRIEVSHPDSLFKFVIEKGKKSLIEHTVRPGFSTPYTLSLYTKSDVHVANLCVYLRDTPVLDQILAISMFIKTGNEEEILKKANFFSLSDDLETRSIISLEKPELSRKLLRWNESEFLQ